MVYFLWVNKPRLKLKWEPGLKRRSVDCYSPGINSLKNLEMNFYVKEMPQILSFWNRDIWFLIILRWLYVTRNSLLIKFCWSECLDFSKICIFKHWKFKDFCAVHVQINNKTKQKIKHKNLKQTPKPKNYPSMKSLKSNNFGLFCHKGNFMTSDTLTRQDKCLSELESKDRLKNSCC